MSASDSLLAMLWYSENVNRLFNIKYGITFIASVLHRCLVYTLNGQQNGYAKPCKLMKAKAFSKEMAYKSLLINRALSPC